MSPTTVPAVIAVAGTEERARAGQDRMLATYLRREVMPYSAVHRTELRAATISRAAQLDRIPPRRPGDLDDPGAMVLRPDAQAIQQSGDVALIAKLWWAQLMRRQESFNRTVLEPTYKPVHWMLSGGLPVGYTAEDMERLGEIGRASLEHAGLTRSDSVVTLDADTSSVRFWQLALGTRRAGIASVHAGVDDDPGAVVARLAPTVVAGPATALVAVAQRSVRLRAVIATDGPHDAATRARLGSLAGKVVLGWAAPGARAMWLSCGSGAFHTWPATEIVERDGGGELLWTPLQWKGSVLLRTRTGQMADVSTGPCAACGRSSARVRPHDAPPTLRGSRKTPGAARPRARGGRG